MHNADKTMYQTRYQLEGTATHKSIEARRYSTRSDILQNKEVYCDRYGIAGRIDVYDGRRRLLTERKKHQSVIYRGLVFQLYAQCFCLREMGYQVERLRIHSMDDNRDFEMALPEDDPETAHEFEETLDAMRSFSLKGFVQENASKCQRCIYAPMCGSTDIQ